MGLIVNKPQSKLRFSKLLEQLDISADGDVKDVRIHYGGPVEMARGFVVHTSDYRSEMGTLDVDGRIGMTATIDVLEDIAKGDGPATSMLALGYAGWGAGQLEQELMENNWLTAPATPEILFSTPYHLRAEAAAKLLGVDLSALATQPGNA